MAEKCRKCKVAKIIGIVVIVLILALIVGAGCAGRIVKHSIQEIGGMVTKCDINIDDFDLSLLRGKLTIKNMVVGNPEGFKTESAFKLGKVHVDLVTSSLFKDRIIINEVQVIGPEITYEVAPVKFTSNIGSIQKNVESFLPASGDKEEKKDEKDEKPKKPGKKIQINHVIVSDGKINVSATFAGGHALPIALPTIEMNDIGKEKDVNGAEASAAVLDKTLGSVVAAASESVKSIGSSVGEGIKGILSGKDKDEEKEKVKEKVKEAADESVKSIGNSVGEGIKELLGGGKDKEKDKAAEKDKPAEKDKAAEKDKPAEKEKAEK